MPTIRPLTELESTPHANVFPTEEPKTIRLELGTDEAVAPHSHPGRDIVFHLLEGEIELELDGDTYEVTAGDVARFDGDQDIAPRAVEPSTALIVLAQQESA
ncbi:cupin domain-containing protein [Natrialba sp. SSL1]|uniref:cupin domain-containing protein n=1 Tax=Natrialba sp. SSL1 TaxID=1869245 RepID=UPI0008F863DF|nr:cupin domain-containing protein [Natrialba sp. SSL1]OIB59093.1 cupin [Natrialba sp. SSL1]